MLWHCDWQRDLPCAVLDWRLGVTPAEMKTLCNDAGLNMVHKELQGFCGTMSVSIEWGKLPWITQYQHTGTQVWCFCRAPDYFGTTRPLYIYTVEAEDQDTDSAQVLYFDDDRFIDYVDTAGFLAFFVNSGPANLGTFTPISVNGSPVGDRIVLDAPVRSHAMLTPGVTLATLMCACTTRPS